MNKLSKNPDLTKNIKNEVVLKKIRLNKIKVNFKNLYVMFIPADTGYYVQGTDTPKGSYIRKIANGLIDIPDSIYMAYDVPVNGYNIYTDTIFIQAAPISKVRKIPGYRFSDNSAAPDFSSMKSSLAKETEYRFKMPWISSELEYDVTVTLYLGERRYAKIEPVKKGYLTYDDIKKEYGRRLQHFCGDKLTFNFHKPACTGVFQLPVYFWKKIGVSSHENVIVSTDGKAVYVRAVPSKECDLTGKTIDAAKHIPVKKVVCASCKEKIEEPDKKTAFKDILSKVDKLESMINSYEKLQKKKENDLEKANTEAIEIKGWIV